MWRREPWYCMNRRYAEYERARKATSKRESPHIERRGPVTEEQLRRFKEKTDDAG